MTISERLKAISSFILKASKDHVEYEKEIAHVEAIQANLSSAEADAGKVVVQLRKSRTLASIDEKDTEFVFNSEKQIVTTALLSQREKYDALIAKAEGCAKAWKKRVGLPDDAIPKTSGWVCPKCGSVYAPHIMECYKCSSPFKVT